MSSYPKFDGHPGAPSVGHGSLFAFDAASVEDDEMILTGPAPSPPPAGHQSGDDTWSGPYGYLVTEWTTGNGFPATGYGGATGYGATGPESWKFDVQIPAGWYTRTTRRDKY